jgi:hypothetical protein
MQCEVLRAFFGEGRQLAIGEIVDTAEWRPRNVEGLIETRYLRPVTEQDFGGYNLHLTRQSGQFAAARRKKGLGNG